MQLRSSLCTFFKIEQVCDKKVEYYLNIVGDTQKKWFSGSIYKNLAGYRFENNFFEPSRTFKPVARILKHFAILSKMFKRSIIYVIIILMVQ